MRVIDTNSAYNEVESGDSIVIVVAKFDKVYIRSSDKYECNNSFILYVVKEAVSKYPCAATKCAGEVCVLILTWKMSIAIEEPMRVYGRLATKLGFRRIDCNLTQMSSQDRDC